MKTVVTVFCLALTVFSVESALAQKQPLLLASQRIQSLPYNPNTEISIHIQNQEIFGTEGAIVRAVGLVKNIKEVDLGFPWGKRWIASVEIEEPEFRVIFSFMFNDAAMAKLVGMGEEIEFVGIIWKSRSKKPPKEKLKFSFFLLPVRIFK